MKKKLDYFYRKIGKWIFNHLKTVLLISCFLFLTSSFLTTKIKIKADLKGLLSQDAPSVVGLEQLEKIYGGVNSLMIGIETQDENTAKSFIDQLAAELQKQKDVKYVEHKRPLDFFHKHYPLYLEAADLISIRERLEKKWEEMKQGAHPFFDRFFFTLEENDSLHFDDIIEKYKGELGASNNSEYFQNGEGSLFALLVRPTFSSTDFEHSKRFVHEIKEIVKNLHPETHGISVSYGGEYQTMIDQDQHLKAEIATISLLVLFALIFSIILFYRRISAIPLITLPLLASIASTGGVVYLLLGHVNLITSFSGPILVGLGSDYGIYLLARYFEEKKQGRTVKQSFFNTFYHTSRSIKTSALTTLAAFAMLCFSSFKGFFEFGLIGLTGILFTLFWMHFLLPALILIFERNKIFAWEERFSPWSINFQFKEKTSRFALLLVSVFIVLLIISLSQFQHIAKLEYDLSKFENQELPSYQTDKKIAPLLGNELRPAAIIVSKEDEKKIIEQAKLSIAIPTQLQMIKKVIALTSVMPSLSLPQKNEILHIQKLLKKMDLKLSGDEKTFQDAFLHFDTQKNIKYTDLPPSLKANFLPEKNDKGLIYAFPTQARDSAEKVDAFAYQLETLLAQTQSQGVIASDILIIRDIMKIIKREAPYLLFAMFLTTFCFLCIEFKNIFTAVLLSAFLISSFLLLFLGMHLFHFRFNFFNLATIPIIYGAGCDSFIHYYHRLLEEKGRIISTLNHIAPSVLFANFTTMIGFGGLILSNNQALASIGWITLIGMISVSLTALLFFPAHQHLLRQSRRKRTINNFRKNA
ncbi:MAG: hypothetical protein COX62_04055 [Deltaproteobacteria bacterium CG_4_10_14_0_2_um_filter_43_8]|nr:MAG: hypothetical protein COV43_00575 [Deltaproteobacteria bacterium CG11_big_fil_rev_8_21_14_0_20_42_23]PJA20807.1 MAG: hypothetical protein COX62_04055 [Deltaproteobacteria bacterium CG_4_10_14_0_2_um_filter_43_8]PJC64514.1 MAG: hypothetical protein CO021_03560 [Deltaproteobacteria bacterium CG_4_9_14_0_2_um_filter_42_21]